MVPRQHIWHFEMTSCRTYSAFAMRHSISTDATGPFSSSKKWRSNLPIWSIFRHDTWYTADSSELFDVSSRKLESSSSPKNFFFSYLFLLFACTYNFTRCRTNHNWLPASHLTCSFTAQVDFMIVRLLWVTFGAFFQNLLHYQDLHKNTLIHTCRKALWAFLLIFF